MNLREFAEAAESVTEQFQEAVEEASKHFTVAVEEARQQRRGRMSQLLTDLRGDGPVEDTAAEADYLHTRGRHEKH